MEPLDPIAQQPSPEHTIVPQRDALSPERPDSSLHADTSADVDRAVPDLLDVLLTVLFAFFSLGLCVAIMVSFVRSYPFFQHVSTKSLLGNALVVIPAQSLGYLFVVSFMAFLVWFRHQSGLFHGIGWNFPGRRMALMAFGGGAAMALGSELLSGLLQRWIPKTLPIDEYFKNAASGYMLAFFGIVVAPFVEEIFFRGFVYPAFARLTGIATAVVITAAGFALLHGGQLANSWAPLMILFGVGTVLTIARARTRSVVFCVLMHMGYNFILFTIMFFATQGFRHMERA